VAASDDRAEREAILARVVADFAPAGGGRTSSESADRVSSVRSGRSWPASSSSRAAARGFVPDDVVVPSATGGTQAGLLVGLRTADAATVVHGIAVTPPDELRPKVAAIVAGLGALDGLARVPEADIRLDDDQLGAGYGRPTEAAAEATRLLARTEGILVDPIYTAKALAGLVARVRSGAFDGRRVVFWHAGGAPGLFEPLGD
jgi:1-aminocyclopropane-1-carboxylate deaminase/D-cysteine desulfhydrase-like pyridoxal-dependent ACC family enzyme